MSDARQLYAPSPSNLAFTRLSQRIVISTPISMTSRAIVPLSSGWTFRQADDVDSDFLETHAFPTEIHLDLLHHGLIPDPFIGKQENKVQWVGEKAWIYRTTFLSPRIPVEKRAILVFEGLDTYAKVSFNGKEILLTENAFLPYRVDVTRYLRPSETNALEIVFEV